MNAQTPVDSVQQKDSTAHKLARVATLNEAARRRSIVSRLLLTFCPPAVTRKPR